MPFIYIKKKKKKITRKYKLLRKRGGLRLPSVIWFYVARDKKEGFNSEKVFDTVNERWGVGETKTYLLNKNARCIPDKDDTIF